MTCSHLYQAAKIADGWLGDHMGGKKKAERKESLCPEALMQEHEGWGGNYGGWAPPSGQLAYLFC